MICIICNERLGIEINNYICYYCIYNKKDEPAYIKIYNNIYTNIKSIDIEPMYIKINNKIERPTKIITYDEYKNNLFYQNT